MFQFALLSNSSKTATSSSVFNHGVSYFSSFIKLGRSRVCSLCKNISGKLSDLMNVGVSSDRKPLIKRSVFEIENNGIAQEVSGDYHGRKSDVNKINFTVPAEEILNSSVDVKYNLTGKEFICSSKRLIEDGDSENSEQYYDACLSLESEDDEYYDAYSPEVLASLKNKNIGDVTGEKNNQYEHDCKSTVNEAVVSKEDNRINNHEMKKKKGLKKKKSAKKIANNSEENKKPLLKGCLPVIDGLFKMYQKEYMAQ